MDYKKAYKEALERAAELHSKTEYVCEMEMLERIFPELKVSEDERIRKGIIRNLEYLMDRAEGFVKNELKERIAWLEKQGKQKQQWIEKAMKVICNGCAQKVECEYKNWKTCSTKDELIKAMKGE